MGQQGQALGRGNGVHLVMQLRTQRLDACIVHSRG